MAQLLFDVNLSVDHVAETRLDHVMDVVSNSATHASLLIINVGIVDEAAYFEYT